MLNERQKARQVLNHGFANEAEFKAEVDRHLRAFAKGELPPSDAPRDKVLLPLAVIAEVQKEKAEKEQALARAEREHQLAEAAVARAKTFALEFAERASKAALEGCDETACFKLRAKLGHQRIRKSKKLKKTDSVIEPWAGAIRLKCVEVFASQG